MFNLKQLSPSITDMTRFDRSHIMVTFHQYSKDMSPTIKKAMADTIYDGLEIHATLEEEISRAPPPWMAIQIFLSAVKTCSR